MITAMQGAKLHAATKLHEAREALACTMSYICWENKEGQQLADMVREIDGLFAKLITNEPASKK